MLRYNPKLVSGLAEVTAVNVNALPKELEDYYQTRDAYCDSVLEGVRPSGNLGDGGTAVIRVVFGESYDEWAESDGLEWTGPVTKYL